MKYIEEYQFVFLLVNGYSLRQHRMKKFVIIFQNIKKNEFNI